MSNADQLAWRGVAYLAFAPRSKTANTAPTIPEISNGSRPSTPHKKPAHKPAASIASPQRPWKLPWALDCNSSPTGPEIQAFPTPSQHAVKGPYTTISPHPVARFVVMPKPRSPTAKNTSPIP